MTDVHDAKVIQLHLGHELDMLPDDQAPDIGSDVLTGEVVVPEVAPEVVKGSGGERRSIVPTALQPDQIKSTVKYHSGLTWHRARYHGLRLPFKYIPLAVVWAGIGFLQLTFTLLNWGMDGGSEFLAREAIGNGDSARYLQLSRHASNRRVIRMPVIGAGAVVLIVACLVLALAAPLWVGLAVATVAIPTLARIGRPAEKPIVTQAVVPPTYEAPTHPIIERALGAMGIPGINSALKDGGHIAWVTDVFRDGPTALKYLNL